MRILGLGLGALLTFVLTFVVALHVHFPGQAALDRLSFEVQEASRGKWLIQAADARLYRLVGVAMDDVVLLQAELPLGRRAGEAEPPPAVPVLRVEELAVRAMPLALLRGEQGAAFRASLYGGTLSGEFGTSEKAQRLLLHGEALDLARVPLEGEEWAIDATGLLRLDGELVIDREDIKASTGGMELEVTDLVFQSASLMGMTLEPTTFSEAVLELQVDDGKANVERGRFASEPVDITVGGDITLNKDLARSRLKLELEVRFSEQFDRFAQMAPNLSAARDDDGVYHFRVTGTLESPRFREQRQTRRTRVTPGRPVHEPGGPVPGLDREPLDVGEDDDAEARRQARRDRIRERREKMLERRNDRGTGPLPGEIDPSREGPLGLPVPADPFGEEEPYMPEDMDVQDVDAIGPEGEPYEGDFIDEPPPEELDEQY